jgi:HD-GYP domain-containing protein (c-di-GMP phosphodiesterase class II)
MIEEMQQAIQTNYEQSTRALVAAVDAKDSYTAAHSRRTSRLLVMLGRRVGIDEKRLTDYKRVAELHDIGKIGISGRILRKATPLAPSEFNQIKAHPLIGYRILSPATFLKDGLDIVLRHHERYDGSGYPGGLKGEEIPFSARFFAIVDAYDAMTTERCYRQKLTSVEAIAEIARTKGSQFDPYLVDLVVPHLKQLEEQGILSDL